MLFPNYLGSIARKIGIGAIPPAIKPKWVLAAVFKKIEDYTIFNIKKTQTLFWRGSWY